MKQIARVIACLTIASLLVAQESEGPDFTSVVTAIQIPVTVRDAKGSYVLGLSPEDFELFDEGVRQTNAKLDITSYPISVVVAIQSSASTANALPLVKKAAELILPIIAGETGEAALISFDDQIHSLQSFTSDPDLLKKGFQSVKPGGRKQHLDDATMEGIRLLRTRGKDRKKILLLISETRDTGSRFTSRDVLTYAELSDVQIHAVSMSHFINILTTPALPNRPNPVPPEQRNPLPMGVLQTDTSDAQVNMGNYAPAVKEIFESIKGAAVPNSLELYSKFTGGREQDFVTLSGLEEAIKRIGEEIHSQYLLTFVPPASEKAGYHRIEVKILSAANFRVNARQGYWWAPSAPATRKKK